MKTAPSFLSTFWLLGLSCLCLLGTPQLGLAQQSDLSVGLAVGISSQPEESDFESTGQTLDLNVNFSGFRAGYNSAESFLNTTFYERNWPIRLKSESYYGAWVFGGDQGSYLYGMLGLTYQINTLELQNGIGAQRTQDFGLLTGAGYLFDLDSLLLGLQWTMISGKSKFNDINVATGSNQFQLATLIPF